MRLFQITAIALLGLTVAAIMRASSKVADQFGDNITDDPRPASLLGYSSSFHKLADSE